MPPQPHLAIVGTIQQAISTLLTTYEPEFLRFGQSLFIAFATILIVWHGIRMMLTRDSLGDDMFQFAKLLLFISFGYALIAFYESPIPGIGISFSNTEFSRDLLRAYGASQGVFVNLVTPGGPADKAARPIRALKCLDCSRPLTPG